jgi:MFS family permease
VLKRPTQRPDATRTIAILLLGAITFSLSQTMMNPAFTEIATRYHATESTVAWTLSGFFLSAAISPGISGRLGDMFGKKKALVVALALFAAGAAVCALSGTITVLVVGRVVMGTGAGIFPLCYSIVRDELPADRMATGVGLLSAMIGVGAGLGFPAGGFLIDQFGLPWLFWLTVAMAAVTAALVGLLVPESPVRTSGRIDWLGGLLFAGGLAGVLFAISQATVWGWLDIRTLSVGAAGLVVLAGFVALERRMAQPLIHLPTFLSPPVLATNVSTFLIGAGGVIAFIAIPQLAQVPTSTGYGLGLSAAQSGVYLVPMAAFMVVSAPIGARLMDRVGPRDLFRFGILLIAAGIGMLAFFHRTGFDLFVWPSIFGIGTGISYAAMPILIVRAVTQAQTGEATGINTLMRNAGNGFGAQISTTLIGASVSTATGLPTDGGFVLAFAAGGAVVLLGLVAALRIPASLGRTRTPAVAVAYSARAGAHDEEKQ